MNASSSLFLTDLPWFAVSDPDEPTPIYDALAVERDMADRIRTLVRTSLAAYAPPEPPARDARTGRFVRRES